MAERLVQRYSDSQTVPHFDDTVTTYREAFAGYPWYEQLTDRDVAGRIEKDIQKSGFGGVWFVDDEGDLIGASWYYDSTPEKIAKERGDALAAFSEEQMRQHGIDRIVWHSMTLVSPKYQNQGMGTELKRVVFDDLQAEADRNGHILYMTRIREDNIGSQKMNEPFGLTRSGITVPASKTHSDQPEGLVHEYWFSIIQPTNTHGS